MTSTANIAKISRHTVGAFNGTWTIYSTASLPCLPSVLLCVTEEPGDKAIPGMDYASQQVTQQLHHSMYAILQVYHVDIHKYKYV